jgi:prevent-host-death family protein
MKFDISTDIIPIGEFKAKMTKWLNVVKDKGHPLVITQNGKPTTVILSPEEFDNLNYSNKFISSVNQSLQDIESGNSYNSKDIKTELLKNRK